MVIPDISVIAHINCSINTALQSKTVGAGVNGLLLKKGFSLPTVSLSAPSQNFYTHINPVN